MSDLNPDTPASPIVVPETATKEQFFSALRVLLIALGGWMVGKGWLDAGIVAAAIPVICLGAPFLWAQYKTRSTQAKLKKMEPYVPDTVAISQSRVNGS